MKNFPKLPNHPNVGSPLESLFEETGELREVQRLAQEKLSASGASVPLVVYRSASRDGETYALAPRSLARVREMLGDAVCPHPRVFIAHETRVSDEHVRLSVLRPIIQLLTGATDGQLRSRFGEIIVRDSMTERVLPQVE